ncbi:MAG: biotin/lipoyl-containing protein [Candidatus Sericytochromatia bacterium]
MKLRLFDQDLDVRQGQGTLTVDGEALPVTVVHRRRMGETWELAVKVGDRPARWYATPLSDGTWAVQAAGGARAIAATAGAERATTGPHGPIRTPMAGVVTALHVAPGQTVATGDPLAVVEAMKMRYTLSAEAEGVVEAVLIAERALVTANQILLHLSPP